MLVCEENAPDQSSSSAIWLFGLSHDPFDSGILTAPSRSAGKSDVAIIMRPLKQTYLNPRSRYISDLTGSFDMASLYTCMHNTYGNCEKCGSLGSISRCPRQPGQNTKLSEIILGNGIEAFGRIWRSFGNALVEHYAWTEGWMAERIAKTARSVYHPAPPIAVLGKQHDSGIELEIHLSEAEWEEVTHLHRDDAMWEQSEESQAGTRQRLWPSTKTAIHVRNLELNKTEVDKVVSRIREQLGEQSVLALQEEEAWNLLWLREDENMRDMGGTVSLDERGWYCVWPSRWSVSDAIPASRKLITSEVVIDGGDGQQEDLWTLRSTSLVNNASDLLTSFRSAPAVSAEREVESNDPVEVKDSHGHDGLPLLFDTQSWLDFDPGLDMVSDIADTPGTLGAPTPSGRIDGDHLAPINHDSVDAVSSKILSPTANPTPAAQRDWDMMNSAYEMNQHEDIITENDFNFFDAPHTSIFDAFDEPNDNAFSTDIGEDEGKSFHEHLTPEKPSWGSTMYALDPPAPPYSLDILPSESAVEVQPQQIFSEQDKSPSQPPETEDDSDDLFGERDDDIEEPFGTLHQESSPDVVLPEEDSQRTPVIEACGSVEISGLGACRGEEQQQLVESDSSGSQNCPKGADLKLPGEQSLRPEERITWLRWAASGEVSPRAKRKRDPNDLVALYGDGLVKDRKGHRKRLLALHQHQSRLRSCQRLDISESSGTDDSFSDVEDDSADEGSFSSWRDYDSKQTAVAAHRVNVPVMTQSRVARFGLPDGTWTCPNLGLEASPSLLLSTTTPAEMHPVAAPFKQSLAYKPNDQTEDVSHHFRSWLTSAVTEDPTLRDWLRGRPAEVDHPIKHKQSTGVKVRLGLCGRSTDLAGDAVKFWTQLGLTPFSGQKDVSTSLFFDPRVISPSDAAAWHLGLERSYMVGTKASYNLPSTMLKEFIYRPMGSVDLSTSTIFHHPNPWYK